MSIASRSKARNVASAHLKNCLLKIRSEVPKKHIMDWDPSESTEIYETNDRNSQVVSFFGPFEPTEIYNNCIDLRLNQLIVAVDTNIFISSLQIVNRLLDPSIVKEDPIILVPLQVLQELDGLKNRRSEDIMLSSKAQLAIKFINEKLLKSELIGEQYSTNYPYENLSADDRIIQSCLKYKRKHRILLLTNDVNLQNKALINDIQAFNDKSILENLCVAKECEMDESYSLKHKPKMKEFRSCEYSLSKSSMSQTNRTECPKCTF